MGTGVAGQSPADQRQDDAASLTFDSAPLGGSPGAAGRARNRAGDRVRQARRATDRPSLRCRAGRIVAPRELWRAQSDASRQPRRAERLDAGRVRARDAETERLRLRLPGRTRRSAWRSRPAIGRCFGRRRKPRRCRSACPGRCACPCAQGADDDAARQRSAPPQRGAPAPTTRISSGSQARSVTFDLLTGETTYVTDGVGGLFGEGASRFDDIGTEISHDLKRELVIGADDPLSARYVLTQTYAMGRDGWRIVIEVDVGECRRPRRRFVSSQSCAPSRTASKPRRENGTTRSRAICCRSAARIPSAVLERGEVRQDREAQRHVAKPGRTFSSSWSTR